MKALNPKFKWVKWPKWHPFDQAKGYRQKLPLERRAVLVQIGPTEETGRLVGCAVGYLRYAAGDKSSPFFVVPAQWGDKWAVSFWSDCLGDDFNIPGWFWHQTIPKKRDKV